MLDWSRLNPSVIEEFRSQGGRVARFGDGEVIILHTIGARSGRVLEVPLLIVREGERILLYASAAGSPRQPAWVFNLRAHPRIDVELGRERFGAEIIELPEAEARAKVEAMAASVAQFADYVKKAAPRRIPVFEIRRAQG